MTYKINTYHKIRNTTSRGAPPLPHSFSNHPNLLIRETYQNAKLQKIFDIQGFGDVKNANGIIEIARTIINVFCETSYWIIYNTDCQEDISHPNLLSKDTY